uniref:Uncharacterized protein n=1 Tax=Eutreptiella gymnastica TaxID=73025 RepID=A0A7S1JIP8_9EUGL|mmetsp:Transcript_99697/g.171687  ORF Transcript_99697/g.171687 Transcript_99697/m.171687 type:complete len:122 (+) Transcript_99697:123-488(+)
MFSPGNHSQNLGPQGWQCITNHGKRVLSTPTVTGACQYSMPVLCGQGGVPGLNLTKPTPIDALPTVSPYSNGAETISGPNVTQSSGFWAQFWDENVRTRVSLGQNPAWEGPGTTRNLSPPR